MAALAGGAAAAAAARRKPYGDINIIGENVSSMPTMWVPYFQRHLRGLQRQLHDAADEGAAARRVRSIWTTAVDFLADVHCLPPELLRHVLYPDLLAGLHLPGTPSGQPRDLLAGITTAAASRPFVKRVNDTAAAWVAGGRGRRLSDDAAFTDDKQLKDMRQLGVVFDQRRQVWRSLTLRERCMAMGFPPDYLDSVSSQSEAEAMLGDSFSVGTILRVLHAMRDDLSCFSAVNLVSLFDGIGGGIQVRRIPSAPALQDAVAVCSHHKHAGCHDSAPRGRDQAAHNLHRGDCRRAAGHRARVAARAAAGWCHAGGDGRHHRPQRACTLLCGPLRTRCSRRFAAVQSHDAPLLPRRTRLSLASSSGQAGRTLWLLARRATT